MSDDNTSDLSIREKNLWVELLAGGAITAYYLPKLFWLLLRGDEALKGSAMVSLIVGVVTMAIGLRIVLAIFLHHQQTPEPMDERDHAIEHRTNGLYCLLLQGSIMLVVLAIALQQGEWALRVSWPLHMTPLVTANILLVLLMLSSLLRDAMKLVLYRRGG